MIGAAKLIAVNKVTGGGPPPASPFDATISPSSIIEFSTNGSATSASTTVYPTGGEPPYTYSWETESQFISINNPNGKSTTFSSSGFNQERSGVAECTVTDNLGAQKVVSCRVSFFFSSSGNQLL